MHGRFRIPTNEEYVSMERFQIPGGTCMETRTAHPYQLLKIWHAREFEPLVEIKLATSGLYLK